MTGWAEAQRVRDEQRRAAVLALPVLNVRRHATLTPEHADDILITSSIGANHEAVALWSTAEGSAALASTTIQPGWASFPDARAPHPVAANVTTHAPAQTTNVPLRALELAHPMVQPLPDGQILVVAVRCRWMASGPDRNAIVYDQDGQVVNEETIGDGIEHVMTTANGDIWVGYFDEGVFGNYGWGDRGAPPPIGAPGLIRYSTGLQQEWTYPGDEGSNSGPIYDCYALNVDGEDAWVCYYADFPLVRIRGGLVVDWQNTVAAGAKALIVSGTEVVLYGGYGPDRDRLALGVLADERLSGIGEYRLVLPDGSPIPGGARVLGRGTDLHIMFDRDWYRLDLDVILNEARTG